MAQKSSIHLRRSRRVDVGRVIVMALGSTSMPMTVRVEPKICFFSLKGILSSVQRFMSMTWSAGMNLLNGLYSIKEEALTIAKESSEYTRSLGMFLTYLAIHVTSALKEIQMQPEALPPKALQ